MKALILAMLMGSSFAMAGTITLEGETCTNSKICYSVPNDAGAQIDLYAVVIHPYVYVYVNGVQYKGTLPGSYPYPSNIVGLPVTDPQGNVAYLTATFESYTTCSRYCTRHWTLVSGEIVQ
jgi:hypothetical protein